MMFRFLIALPLLLSACSGGSQGPVTRLTRALSPEEKAEQRSLVEAFSEKPQAEVVGQTQRQHRRVFELADRVLDWPDGRRGYHYVLRTDAEEEEGKISNVLILTDGVNAKSTEGGSLSSPDSEKVLEVQVFIPVS
jgi:hypothetical protein